MQRTSSKYILKIVVVGVMAALVFATSNLQIKLPVAAGEITRIHLGNSMCLLAGLLFGGVTGGLSAGIGSCIFDLLDPVFISSAPFTFVFKFLLAFVCGIIAHSKLSNGTNTKLNVMGAILGQLTYIILYLSKGFLFSLLEGNAVSTAWITTGQKALASSVNAIAAIIIAVPLALIIRKSLSKTSFSQLMNTKKL